MLASEAVSQLSFFFEVVCYWGSAAAGAVFLAFSFVRSFVRSVVRSFVGPEPFPPSEPYLSLRLTLKNQFLKLNFLEKLKKVEKKFGALKPPKIGFPNFK